MFIHIPVPGRERPLLIFCFVFMLGIGGYELYRGLTAGVCRQVSAAELENGKPVPGVWLKVRGRALWAEASRRSEDNGYSVYVVPVISDEPGARKHAAVFLEYRLKDQPAPSGQTGVSDFDGTVISSFLRGLGRDDEKQLEARGITCAMGYVLLTPGGTPGDLIRDSYLFLGIAAVCLGLIPFVGWVKRKFP